MFVYIFMLRKQMIHDTLWENIEPVKAAVSLFYNSLLCLSKETCRI